MAWAHDRIVEPAVQVRFFGRAAADQRGFRTATAAIGEPCFARRASPPGVMGGRAAQGCVEGVGRLVLTSVSLDGGLRKADLGFHEDRRGVALCGDRTARDRFYIGTRHVHGCWRFGRDPCYKAGVRGPCEAAQNQRAQIDARAHRMVIRGGRDRGRTPSNACGQAPPFDQHRQRRSRNRPGRLCRRGGAGPGALLFEERVRFRGNQFGRRLSPFRGLTPGVERRA